WGPTTALVEGLEDPREPDTDNWAPQANRKVTLKGFAQGLRADLGVAHLFADRESEYLRGIAAPLFYASANRLLLMTGGTRAKWNGTRFETRAEGATVFLRVQAVADLVRPLTASDGTVSQREIFVTGRPVKFLVEALDANGAHVSGYRGTVNFETTDAGAAVPQAYSFTEADAGMKILELTFRRTGEQKIFVRDTSNTRVRGEHAGIRVVSSGSPDATGATARRPVFVATAPKFQPQCFGGWSLRGESQAIRFDVQVRTDLVKVTGDVERELTVAQRPVTLVITARDSRGELAGRFTGRVALEYAGSGPVEGPAEIAFAAGDGGVRSVEIVFQTPGNHRVSARDVAGGAIQGELAALEVLRPDSPQADGAVVRAPAIARGESCNVQLGTLAGSPQARYLTAPWDWGGYDPTKEQGPSPLRLLNAEFLAGPAGVPVAPLGATESALVPPVPYEDLDSLGTLLASLAEFLRVTRPGAPLGNYLGDGSNVGDVLDPTKPMIFPRDGRMLAVGVLAGVLKNLVAPDGHIMQTSPGTPGGELGLAFYDRVNLGGKVGNPVPVRSVSQLLIVAATLQRELSHDPDVPDELKALLPQLGDVLTVGGFTLGAKGQEPDGGFREFMGQAQPSGRNLRNSVLALRALTYAFEQNGMLAVMIRVKNGWDHLDRVWGDADVPSFVQGPTGGAPASPSDLWELLNLWEETRATLQGHPHTQLDWPKWERRFQVLGNLLRGQLQTQHGPVALGL
ncbi:MAG: hypothetical protein IT285_04375, partial [Bdellovibrionales bacterium]|nr:hypothetical protein [Bdellovibrionales bacterium]